MDGAEQIKTKIFKLLEELNLSIAMDQEIAFKGDSEYQKTKILSLNGIDLEETSWDLILMDFDEISFMADEIFASSPEVLYQPNIYNHILEEFSTLFESGNFYDWKKCLELICVFHRDFVDINKAKGFLTFLTNLRPKLIPSTFFQ